MVDRWWVHSTSMVTPETVDGPSMSCPWWIHGGSIVFPWRVHGESVYGLGWVHGESTDGPSCGYVSCLHDSWRIRGGQSMVGPWTVHGVFMDSTMDSPWTIHDEAMVGPWTVHGWPLVGRWELPSSHHESKTISHKNNLNNVNHRKGPVRRNGARIFAN